MLWAPRKGDDVEDEEMIGLAERHFVTLQAGHCPIDPDGLSP